MSLQQFSTPPAASGPRRPPLRAGASYSPLPMRSFSLPSSPIHSHSHSEKRGMELGMDMSEKRSIDVPCIILTEPDSRSILVQPSSSLPLPLGSRPDPSRSGWRTLFRSAAVLAAVGLGVWHMWSVLGQFDLDLDLDLEQQA